MQHIFTKNKKVSDGGTDVCRGNNRAGGVSARSAAKCCLPDVRCAGPLLCSDSGTNGGRTHAPAISAALVRFFRRGLFRRLQGVLVCCAAILFFGCGTILPPQGDESSANGTQNPSQKTYTVSGSIALSGAVPSAVSAQNVVSGATGGTENTVYGAVQNDADKTLATAFAGSAAAQETPRTSLGEPAGTNARNARPSVDSTTVSYTVTVTDANDATNTQTLTLAAGETDFSFNLPEGTYTFSAEGFVEDADGTRKKILSGSYKNTGSTPPDTVSVPTATPAETISVAVAPAATGSGTGTVNLLMECSDCKQFTAEWNDKSGTPKTMNRSVPAESTGWCRYTYFTLDENGNGYDTPAPEVPVGQYEVTFTFYGYAGASLPYYKMYSCTEIINVCENMTTDYWEQDAQSLHCIGDGKFELTSAAIAEFRFRDRHDFYVDQTNGTIDGDGSRFKPRNDVWSAVYDIQRRNDGKPYTVHLLSDCTYDAEASCNNSRHYSCLDITPSSAFNLTIKGGGHTIDAARTDTYTGRVMYIGENTTLTLDNVVITGGKCATNYSGADGACGGGIYNKGTLTLKNRASVQGNTAYLQGGGIYNDGGTVTIAGGAVSQNTGSNGGGIANASGTVILKDGTISENTLTGSSGRGGGVYIADGTFTMGGSASVPAGDDGKNDVYLAGGKTIGIASTLTAESPVATITPNAYTKGTAVLERASGSTATLADECEKFAVTAEADGTEWLVAEDGTLKTSVPEGFVEVEGTEITGSETWTPSSSVFVSGRTVTIPDMYVSDHEVTQKEYEAYCTYGGSSAPSDSYGKGDNYPAYYVNWYDAVVYCNLRSLDEGLTPAYKMGTETDPKNWSGTVESGGKYCGPSFSSDWDAITYNESADGYRLPTEAEWEYIARGGKTPSGTTYSGSDTIEEVAWYTTNSGSKTHEVKQKAANALGLYDMSGNVREWCWDWYGSISGTTAPAGSASGFNRVDRGSSWSSSAYGCAVSSRNYGSPNVRYDSVGFRVVRSVSQ